MLCSVDSVKVYDWEGCEEHLGRWFGQLAAPAVPPSPIEIESMDVDPFSWWYMNILLHHFSDVVVQNDRVEGPALVSTCDLLPHGRQEALRVKEPSHPEDVWSSGEDPLGELAVSLQQFCEPESKCGGLP